MTNKELTLLGMALDSLLELNEIEKVKEIVKVMALPGEKVKLKDNTKGKKQTDG
ncbi:MAG: hypothetical protein FWG44_05930 [Oscillospiraceae bacterium]|nr:hypothetical protein [Oscillospiraceae bacterium]